MTTAPKRPPGRPRKPIKDKPQQFSIRLLPRSKLGLELLAADSQESLSQITERALEQLFAKATLSNGRTVAEVLRDFPPNPTAAERVLLTYRSVPNALPISERFAAELVWHSAEMADATKNRDSDSAAWEVISWASQNWTLLLEVARRYGPKLMAGVRANGVNLHREIDGLLAELTQQPAEVKKRSIGGGLL